MKPMSKVVTTVAQITFWFMIVFGIYVILHGHLTPGGGFQGGVILASGYAMLLVAYGKDGLQKLLPQKLTALYALLGCFLVLSFLLLFLPTAAVYSGGIFETIYHTLAGPHGLFHYPVAVGINPGDLNTGGTLPLKNIATGLEVLSGLLLIVVFMYQGINDSFRRDESGLAEQGGDLRD